VRLRILGLGLLIMVVSLFADQLALGGSPGFGKGQVIGVVSGFSLACIGFMSFLSR
jgi:hypothetical protein